MEIKARTNYPGKVKGTIVLNPFNLHMYSNPVLVVSDFLLDHTIFLGKVKAVLIRRDSILTHAAIITREFRIPSAVGVNYEFKEGEVVEIEFNNDGTTLIRICSDK
ncbi:hypothetical protein DRN75_02910 [Nanoarchaeota archaeon]|nr:MAG: hypothetical protein DRN75_02910 [Nanoarchaeota archaeon]